MLLAGPRISATQDKAARKNGRAAIGICTRGAAYDRLFVMSDTLTRVMPSATPTDEEIAAWNELPATNSSSAIVSCSRTRVAIR